MRSNPQRASLYRRHGTVLAYPEDQTVAGFFISAEPYMLVPELSAQMVGRAVLRALADSKTNVAHPARDEWSAHTKKRLSAAGADSEGSFMRGAQLVSIGRNAEFLLLVPHKNDGASGKKRGFHALDEYATTVPGSSDEASIGAACIEALARCQ
jgi:hypothetical protein